jgi:hypothetical protein
MVPILEEDGPYLRAVEDFRGWRISGGVRILVKTLREITGRQPDRKE